jgi:hypothetical protein
VNLGPRLVSHFFRPRLQFDQQVRWLRKNRKLRQFAPYHRHFIATMQTRTDVAILIDLVGKVFALRDRESLARKKVWLAREKADAVHPMAFGFRHQSLHQATSTALALFSWSNRDRTNLGEVRAVKVQRAASDDLSVFFLENHEVSDVFADLRQRARLKRAVSRVRGDQMVNGLCIRQDRFTRAHGPPREEYVFCFLLR